MAIKSLLSIAPVFENYLIVFQGEGPLVHCMFSEMKNLMTTLMRRFLKPTEIDGKLAKELLSIDVKDPSYHHDLSKMDFGLEVKTQVCKIHMVSRYLFILASY